MTIKFALPRWLNGLVLRLFPGLRERAETFGTARQNVKYGRLVDIMAEARCCSCGLTDEGRCPVCLARPR